MIWCELRWLSRPTAVTQKSICINPRSFWKYRKRRHLFTLKRNLILAIKKFLCITDNITSMGNTALLIFTKHFKFVIRKKLSKMLRYLKLRGEESLFSSSLNISPPFCEGHRYIGFCLKLSSKARTDT